MRGALLLAGVDPTTLTARQALDVLDYLTAHGDHVLALNQLGKVLAVAPVPERRTWGTDPQAREGQRAMIRAMPSAGKYAPKPPRGGDSP